MVSVKQKEAFSYGNIHKIAIWFSNMKPCPFWIQIQIILLVEQIWIVQYLQVNPIQSLLTLLVMNLCEIEYLLCDIEYTVSYFTVHGDLHYTSHIHAGILNSMLDVYHAAFSVSRLCV